MATAADTRSASPTSEAFRPGVLARAIAVFSGGVGYAIKLVFLCLTNALAVWAVYVLITHHRWVTVAILAVATALIDAIYLVPRNWTAPAKFLVPGTIFLIAFQII